jgi:hypothetical protein
MTPKRGFTRNRQNNVLRKKYSSVLIIECDAKKLESQSINIAQEFNKIFSLFPICKHTFVRIFNKADLLSQFAELATEKHRYDIIILAGHSIIDRASGNPTEIQFASDCRIKWNLLPKYLDIFKPKCLVLATCKGSHLLPSSEMFDGLKSLKELYGTPVITNQAQIAILKLLIPFIIASDNLDPNILLVGNVLNYLATGGFILRHTRKEFRENKPFCEMHQVIYEFLYDLYKKQ